MGSDTERYINAALNARDALSSGKGHTWIVHPLTALVISQCNGELSQKPPAKGVELARDALRRLQAYQRQDATYLRRAIRTELRHYEKNQESFRVLVPLWLEGQPPQRITWVTGEPKLRRCTGQGMRRKWPGLRASLDDYTATRRAGGGRLPMYSNERVVPYVTNVAANSYFEAADMVDDMLLAWRGMYEMVAGARWGIRFGKYLTATVAAIPPPLFFAVGQLDSLDHSQPLYTTAKIAEAGRIKPEAVEALEDWLRLMRRVTDLHPFFTKVALRYGLGLDAGSLGERFLWSWQTIESAVCGEEINGDTTRIANRAAVALGGDEFWRGIMYALANLRNQFVHPGRFIAADQQINNAVRYAAASVARKVFEIAIELKSLNALKAYFRLATSPKTTIGSTIRAAKLIQKSRNS